MADLLGIWQHSQTALLVANGPTLVFALAGIGLIGGNDALLVAQALTILLLGRFGGRIGWRVGGTAPGALFGAGLTGGLGILLSTLKHLIH